jgi:hypothetical protein
LEFGWNVQKLRVAYGDSRFLHRGNIEVAVATHLGTTVITLLFCWLARRSGVKRTWLVIACLVCAYYAFFLTAGVTRGNFFVILNVYHPQWAQAAIPLAAAAFFCLQRQWQAHRCTNAPA